MKIAISVPDDLFRKAEAAARRFRLSRSELYSTAIAQFLKIHSDSAVTERLNEIYARDAAKLDEKWLRVQLKTLETTPW